MRRLKLGGAAALTQAAISAANLIVAVGVLPALGFRDMAELTDPARALALRLPLIALELFKLASALAIGLTLFAVTRRWPGPNRVAVVAGAIGVGALLLAGLLGLVALLAPSPPASSVTGFVLLLGQGAIAGTGIWVLGSSWVALQSSRWPKGLNTLGLGLGGLSLPVMLLPPLALLVLVLGLIWYLWLGVTLLRAPAD